MSKVKTIAFFSPRKSAIRILLEDWSISRRFGADNKADIDNKERRKSTKEEEEDIDEEKKKRKGRTIRRGAKIWFLRFIMQRKWRLKLQKIKNQIAKD